MSQDREQLRVILRMALPVLVLTGGLVIAVVLASSRSEPNKATPEPIAPLVEVRTLEPRSLHLDVETHGTVRARTVSTLVAEVAGRVVEVSSSLDAGGFFKAGEPLVQIEKRDYELAVTQAAAELARANQSRAIEQAEAAASIEEWNAQSSKQAPELVRRVPQLAAANAQVESAKARLEAAQRDVARTAIHAPYSGRVSEKLADVGQFVGRGTPVARVYAVDYAEVRLPLHDSDLAFVDIPIAFRDDRSGSNHPEVELTAQFAGELHSWVGRIVRTEGELGDRSRMVHAIARIDDPYASTNGDGAGNHRPPLLVGMFVNAKIRGRKAENVFVVPREALRGQQDVLIVDEGTIEIRRVDVLRIDDEHVFVRGGLAAGESLCLTRLETYTDGMRVRTRDLAEQPANKPTDPAEEDR